MSTTVQYGPVTLEECQTLEYEQTVQYDESGTDMLYHKF